ncbi:MAG: hypothetical protein JWQ87_5562 [Candidatus Sulfotelmatobacter sp.]|nr:hypothetical protein [Candidatus Sulfotelmatobacter sp.]
MDIAQDFLRQRFPILEKLRISDGSDTAENLATFMGVLLAAMERSRYASFCFVFPRKQAIAPLSAVLYSLSRFSVEFPALAEEYAQRSFQKGQRVRLVPEGKIYVFGGVWPGLETRFRLELLNENAAFTWPISEILRIEPTQRKIPKGRFADADNARSAAPLSPLDRLIGTRTFGNSSLGRNYVLYLGGRNEMEKFLENTSLIGTTSGMACSVGALLAAGHIDESGTIRHHDSYQAAGEPLIAISSQIENVAAACGTAAPRSRVVIVDGARRITDLSRFDSIAERQNLIIVAETDDEDKLRELHDRGCRFWRFSLEDLEMKGQGENGGRFFDGIFRSARNEATLKAEITPCVNDHLEQLSVALDMCQKTLGESEGDETHHLLVQIFGLLTHCAGLLEPPDHAERDRLRVKSDRIISAAGARMMWLPDTPATALRDACKALKSAIEDPQLGEAKGRATRELLDNLQREGVAGIGLVARSASHRRVVQAWAENKALTYPVLLPSGPAAGDFFERLICTAWSNSGQFAHLVRRHAAPLIYLVAYPFEGRWLRLFKRRQRDASAIPSISSSEKTGLVGLSGDHLWPEEPVAPPASDESGDDGVSAYDFEEVFNRSGVPPVAEPGEDSVPARLVSFSGDSFAFLTETLRIPVITELVSGEVDERYKVPLRKLREIRPGDVLVFRDGGRKDVIRALADAQLGAQAPFLRETAARWHQALRQSSLGEAALINELEEVNCPRTSQTVHSWLTDDSMIGPQTRADLEAIAYAVGDQKLLESVPEMWNAIQVLRGEHLSAGMRLSRILLEQLPQRRAQLHEGKTRVEIDNATSAWIVQVENIGDRAELRPRSQINTVLSYDEDLV